tara:strand:+ start:1537 stop:2490 length:954 start_codon:yes stop_codon:yes gene_type:complete
MSELKTNKISPATGTALAVGDSGDTITVPSGATFTVDGTLTLSDGSIANAKLANMAANTVKVRDANSSGVPSDKALATTEILIGDGTGFTAAALSGDVTMANTGAVTIATDAVDIAMLSATGTASATTFLRGDNAWAEPGGGGLIFLSKNTLSDAASTWDITDCFTATYSKYLVQVSRLQTTTENVDLYCTVGNSDLSSISSWQWMWTGLGTNGTTHLNMVGSSAGGFLLQDGQHNTTSGWSGNFWIFNPFGTDGITRSMGQGEAYANASAEGFWNSSYGGDAGTASAVSMRFYASSGDVGDAVYDGQATLYGLAES